MLNLQSSENRNTIEIKQRDIEIFFEEERNLSMSIGIPSADELMESHCAPIPNISLHEVCSLDPFNFEEIIGFELSSLKAKFDRFKDSPTFISKIAGLTTLTGDLDSAEELLSKSADEVGSNFLIQSLGNVCVLKGDLQKAFAVFSSPELSNDVFSNLRLAYLKTKSNELVDAQKYLDKALEIDPSDFKTRMFSGAMHLNNGECEKAIRDFRVANEEKVDSSALHVNLAASHWSLGHTKKALRELTKAISINPLNENAVVFFSDALFSLGSFEKSIKHLEFFNRFDEKSEFVWARLARAYYFSKKYAKARFALEKQLAICDHPSIWNNLGLVHWKLKNGKKALSYFYHSLEKSENNAKQSSYPILNLASILNEVGNSKECLRFLSSFKRIDSDEIDEDVRAKIQTQLLIALEETNNYDTLLSNINYLVKSTNYKNAENITLFHIYKVYADTVINKSYEDTKNSIAKLLVIEKEFSKELSKESIKLIYNNICFSLLYFNKTKEAEKHISKISNNIHHDSYCTATLGLLRIKKGDLDNGLKLYSEAISLANKKDLKSKIRQRMLLEAGKHFLNFGDQAQAKKSLSKALNEKHGHFYALDEAKQLLAALR